MLEKRKRPKFDEIPQGPEALIRAMKMMQEDDAIDDDPGGFSKDYRKEKLKKVLKMGK